MKSMFDRGILPLSLISAIAFSASANAQSSFVFRAHIDDKFFGSPSSPVDPGTPTVPDVPEWVNSGAPVCGEWLPDAATSAFDHNFIQARSCSQLQTYTPASGEVESRHLTNDEQRNIVFELVEVGIPVITNPANPNGRFAPGSFNPSFNTSVSQFTAAGWVPGTTVLFTANGLKSQAVDSRYLANGELIWSKSSELTENIPVTMKATLSDITRTAFDAPYPSTCSSTGGSPLLGYTANQLAMYLYNNGSVENIPVSCYSQELIFHTLHIEKSHPQAMYGTIANPIGDTYPIVKTIRHDLDSLVSFSVREENLTEPSLTNCLPDLSEYTSENIFSKIGSSSTSIEVNASCHESISKRLFVTKKYTFPALNGNSFSDQEVELLGGSIHGSVPVNSQISLNVNVSRLFVGNETELFTPSGKSLLTLTDQDIWQLIDASSSANGTNPVNYVSAVNTVTYNVHRYSYTFSDPYELITGIPTIDTDNIRSEQGRGSNGVVIQLYSNNRVTYSWGGKVLVDRVLSPR